MGSVPVFARGGGGRAGERARGRRPRCCRQRLRHREASPEPPRRGRDRGRGPPVERAAAALRSAARLPREGGRGGVQARVRPVLPPGKPAGRRIQAWRSPPADLGPRRSSASSRRPVLRRDRRGQVPDGRCAERGALKAQASARLLPQEARSVKAREHQDVVERAVGDNIAAAPLQLLPYPHVYVREVFPRDFYGDIQRHLPPSDLLMPLQQARGVRGYPQRFVLELVPERLAAVPEPYRGFWSALAGWMLGGAFAQRVLDKFRGFIDTRFKDQQPEFGDEALLVNDRTDYSLGPHTDTTSKVVSMLFYLPGDDRLEKHGTSLYVPRKPGFTCEGGPHYRFDGFERVATMPFLPNTLFAFAKTDHSFHGVEPIAAPGIRSYLLLYDLRVKHAH